MGKEIEEAEVKQIEREREREREREKERERDIERGKSVLNDLGTP